MEHRSSVAQLTGRPDVSVILVSYNTANLLERLLDTLRASKGSLDVQVIAVDNHSRDDSVQILRTHPDVELIENSANVGFARANNQALANARGRYILLLNTDAFVAPDTLQKTVEYMDAHPKCGVLGVKLVGEDGALQPSCRYFPTPWNSFLITTGLNRFFPNTRLIDDMSWDHQSIRECDWVPGCYYLIRREVIEQVGLFDPRYFVYCEEVDHCQAVRKAGWNVVYFPFTQVIHIGGQSAKSDAQLDATRQISKLHIESELIYFRKHYGLLGALAAVALSILADAMKAGWGIVRRMDTQRARMSIHHSKNVIKGLIATRFALRPTR